MDKEQLDQLLESVRGKKSVLILPHNNPDPDAIASAVALRYLLNELLEIKPEIVYQGIIGRAENKALVHYLGRPLRRLNSTDLGNGKAFALVDTQPGAGNNVLPIKRKPTLVIDHHPWRDETQQAIFFDVRPEVGAASSVMTEYLREAQLEPPARLATALFYGIKTDTMGLCRGTSPADTEAFCFLQHYADIEALLKIERAQVPIDYFQSFAATLQNAEVYGNIILAYLGTMSYPDQAAEIADLLLRLRKIRWVICFGVHRNRLFLSVRTYKKRGAGQLAQHLMGAEGAAGGHGAMAGGWMKLNGEDPKTIVERMKRRALDYLKVSPDDSGRPLIQ
jgi:nanoRNase/pAp phosphatase (c-di-AMP/oligoRNAs hydrolase)